MEFKYIYRYQHQIYCKPSCLAENLCQDSVDCVGSCNECNPATGACTSPINGGTLCVTDEGNAGFCNDVGVCESSAGNKRKLGACMSWTCGFDSAVFK